MLRRALWLMGAMSYEKKILKSVLESKVPQDQRGNFLLDKYRGNKQRVGASGWFSLWGQAMRRLLQGATLGPFQLNKLINHLEGEARG